MALSNRVVVDASVAVKWFVREPDAEAAMTLLSLGAHHLAPSLVFSEVARALQRKERDGYIEPAEVDRCLRALRGYFQEVVEVDALLPSAMALARELSHPIYDCIYLALALSHDALVVTADAALLAKVKGTPHESLVASLASCSSWPPFH